MLREFCESDQVCDIDAPFPIPPVRMLIKPADEDTALGWIPLCQQRAMGAADVRWTISSGRVHHSAPTSLQR